MTIPKESRNDLKTRTRYYWLVRLWWIQNRMKPLRLVGIRHFAFFRGTLLVFTKKSVYQIGRKLTCDSTK